MNRTFFLTAPHLPELILLLQEASAVGEHIITIKKRSKQRTRLQNRALHKYFEIIAEKLNDGGYTQKGLMAKFKESFDLPITPELIKGIFREVGKVLYKKDSTSKLTTKEIQEVYLIVDQRFSEMTGVRSDWPSIEPPIF